MSRSFFIAKTLVSRKWLLSSLVVLLGMSFLARLGIWQLDRLEQRRTQNSAFQKALDAPPFELNEDTLPEDFESLKDHDVIIKGEYDFSQQIILKLQNWGGSTGVHLVTPLLLEGDDIAVLVDQGWVPESESYSENWSKFNTLGLVTINGYISLSQTLPRTAANEDQSDGFQKEWYRIDIQKIQAQLPYRLLPVYVSEAPADGGDAEPPFRSEREIDLSEGPHLGYAIQWFIFSATLGIFYIVYVNKHVTSTADIKKESKQI